MLTDQTEVFNGTDAATAIIDDKVRLALNAQGFIAADQTTLILKMAVYLKRQSLHAHNPATSIVQSSTVQVDAIGFYAAFISQIVLVADILGLYLDAVGQDVATIIVQCGL